MLAIPGFFLVEISKYQVCRKPGSFFARKGDYCWNQFVREFNIIASQPTYFTDNCKELRSEILARVTSSGILPLKRAH